MLDIGKKIFFYLLFSSTCFFSASSLPAVGLGLEMRIFHMAYVRRLMLLLQFIKEIISTARYFRDYRTILTSNSRRSDFIDVIICVITGTRAADRE